jgi:hypothetical protein
MMGMSTRSIAAVVVVAALCAPLAALAQGCPEKNVNYWQSFTAGGESDIAARHQQIVLKKRCPAIETVIQYKPGAGGALMWSQMNSLPGDGYNIVGINLPHIVFQPLEGQVQYKTEEVTPGFWFHYTPDALVVAGNPADQVLSGFRERRPRPSRQDFALAAHGLNPPTNAAHEPMNRPFGFKTTYGAVQGHLWRHEPPPVDRAATSSGAMSITAFAINNKGKCRGPGCGDGETHPLRRICRPSATGRRLGGRRYGGIGMPKSTRDVKKRVSDLWMVRSTTIPR